MSEIYEFGEWDQVIHFEFHLGFAFLCKLLSGEEDLRSVLVSFCFDLKINCRHLIFLSLLTTLTLQIKPLTKEDPARFELFWFLSLQGICQLRWVWVIRGCLYCYWTYAWLTASRCFASKELPLTSWRPDKLLFLQKFQTLLSVTSDKCGTTQASSLTYTCIYFRCEFVNPLAFLAKCIHWTD